MQKCIYKLQICDMMSIQVIVQKDNHFCVTSKLALARSLCMMYDGRAREISDRGMEWKI